MDKKSVAIFWDYESVKLEVKNLQLPWHLLAFAENIGELITQKVYANWSLQPANITETFFNLHYNCCHIPHQEKVIELISKTIINDVEFSLNNQPNVEIIILLIGKGNYAKLVQNLRQKHKQLIIISYFNQPEILINYNDKYYSIDKLLELKELLTDMPEITMNNPMQNLDKSPILKQALTHRSYVNENLDQKLIDNERLEFLGDALLNFLSAEYLYNIQSELSEAEMTRRRAGLVEQKQLALFAQQTGLDTKMRLGKGAILEGGLTNPNLLSSTFEAFIAAYYLDNNGDIKQVKEFIKKLFDQIAPTMIESRSNVDSKNRFQEWVQANLDGNTPKYITIQSGGKPHEPEFLAKVYVDDQLYGEGIGKSKKEAEKKAAENALITIKQ